MTQGSSQLSGYSVKSFINQDGWIPNFLWDTLIYELTMIRPYLCELTLSISLGLFSFIFSFYKVYTNFIGNLYCDLCFFYVSKLFVWKYFIIKKKNEIWELYSCFKLHNIFEHYLIINFNLSIKDKISFRIWILLKITCLFRLLSVIIWINVLILRSWFSFDLFTGLLPDILECSRQIF